MGWGYFKNNVFYLLEYFYAALPTEHGSSRQFNKGNEQLKPNNQQLPL